VTDAWKASAKVKLDDCAADGYWKFDITNGTGDKGGNVAYTATTSSAECEGLAPAFKTLARSL
jgi:hypothetical protein